MQHENTCIYMYTHPGWTSTTLKWNQPASARWRLIRKMKTGNFMSVETIAFLGKYYFNFPTWIQQVFGQEAMQHQRGKANGGIAWGEFFLIWVHGHRKWAAVVDAWCDSCLAWCILLKIFRTLVAPNVWMVVFWYKQLHNGKVQYFWMQAQKMLVTPLN